MVVMVMVMACMQAVKKLQDQFNAVIEPLKAALIEQVAGGALHLPASRIHSLTHIPTHSLTHSLAGEVSVRH